MCQWKPWRAGHKEECKRLRDSSSSSAASSASCRNSSAGVRVTNRPAASDEFQAAAALPFQAATICVQTSHGIVVDTNGYVQSWGRWDDCEVSRIISPRCNGYVQRVVSVSVGFEHLLMLTTAGSVFSYGQNNVV